MFADNEDKALTASQALGMIGTLSMDHFPSQAFGRAFSGFASLDLAKRCTQRVSARTRFDPQAITAKAGAIVSDFYAVIDTTILGMAAKDARTLREPSIESEKILSALGGEDALFHYRHMVKAEWNNDVHSDQFHSAALSVVLRHSRQIREVVEKNVDNVLLKSPALRDLVNKPGNKGMGFER